MATVLSSSPVAGVLRAENLERARRFYRDTLGLRVDDSGEGQFIAMAGDDTRFMVYENPSLEAPGNTTLGFTVPDVRAAVAELREIGIEFAELDMPEMRIKTVDGVASSPEGDAAWFKDSEGNWIALSSM